MRPFSRAFAATETPVTMDSSGGMIPWKPAGPDYEPSVKMRREEAAVKRFGEEKKRQEKARENYHKTRLAAAIYMKERQHKLIYETFQKQLGKSRLENTYNYAVYASMKAAWRNLEQLDLASLIVLDQRDITKRMRGKEAVSSSAHEDIQAFEGKGYELGAEAKDPDAGADSKKKPAKPPPKGKKEEAVPATVDPAVLAQQGKAYLEDIKSRKSKEETEKYESQQNRKKETMEQLEREKELEEAKKKEEEEQTVKKKEEEEARQAELLQMAQAEEESLIAYRKMLEQQIAEQRNREWQAVLARDRELLMMMRQDCFENVEQEHQLVEAEKKRKSENRKARHIEMCREIILQIVSLAESMACYRESTESDLPMMEWREWQNLFVKGVILPSPLCSEMISTESQTTEANVIADEAAAMEYFHEQGEWTGVVSIGKNKELGIILDIIHSWADAQPKPVPIPSFAEMTLKLATVGTAYSGKTLVASRIAADFGITRIEMDTVINFAVAEAEAEEANRAQHAANADASRMETTVDTTPKEANADEPQTENLPTTETEEAQAPPLPPTKAQLGRDVKNFLQQGLQVPDDLMVSLLVLTISSLNAADDDPADASQKKGKAAPKKPNPKDKKGGGKGAEPEMDITGFIVDGFPNTAGQAAAFEKALTGIDFEFEARHRAEASVLAPPPPAERVDKLVSGLDGIFLMQCPDEGIALNRALGKRVDTKTDLFYHLDYEPPPANDKTGITARLKPVEEPDGARVRFADGMQLWPPLASWMEKFLNVYWVGHEENGKVKPEDAITVVKGFVAARAQADAAAAAANAAKEAEEATKQALAETEKAKLGSDIASKHLYFAKLAEIEAAAVLEAFPADPLAKETLRVKASTMAGQKLNEAIKALKEIQNAVEVAQKASLQAQEAANKAQEAAAGAEACFQARVDAEVAAEAAKQAAARATLTCQKAGFVYESAARELTEIEKPEEVAAKAEEAEAEQKHDATQELTPSAEPAPQYPELDVSTAERLHGTWKEVESRYFANLKNLFHNFRVERSTGRTILQELKLNFGLFLKRPDNKQKIFDDFQGKYNRVDLQQRRTPKMKPTLKKLVDDLAKQLRSICDQRLKEAQESCKKSLAEWITQRTSSCVSLFTSLMQIELDRHLQSCNFLHEYYFRKPSSAVLYTFNPIINLVETAPIPPKTFPVPGWITGISASSPQISLILTKAIFLVDSVLKAASDPDLDARSKSTRKSKPPGGGLKVEGKGLKPKSGDASDAELSNVPAAMLKEHEIVQSRLQLLASKACAYVGELQPLLDGSSKRMEEWMNNCYKVESEIVAEVIELSEEAVEECIPLWYHMNLDGGELSIDQAQIVVEPPPPLTVQPIVDVNNWHFNLLEDFVESLRKISPTGYIEMREAASALQQAIGTAHNKGKEDVNFSQVPHLPATKGRPFGPFQIWAHYMNQVMKVPPQKIETETVQIIDWRALVMTLADMHLNDCVSASSLEDVMQVCNLLEEGSKETAGLFSLESFVSIPFWFDQAANQGAVDIGARLKKLAYQTLQAQPEIPEEAGSHGIPWQRLGLYFCRDEDKAKALSKVFQVLVGTKSDVLELKPDQLLQAIYHLSIDGASKSGCLTWATQDLRELILKIKSETAPQPKPSLDEVETEDSDGSQGSDKLCTRSTVAHRGSNLSDQTNITVADFVTDTQDISSFTEVCTEISSTKEAKSDSNSDPNELYSELSEQAADTIKQFLEALESAPPEKAAPPPPPTEVIERLVSVKELLSAQSAGNLCSTLLENYCSKQVHVMNVKKAIEGDRPKEEFAEPAAQ